MSYAYSLRTQCRVYILLTVYPAYRALRYNFGIMGKPDLLWDRVIRRILHHNQYIYGGIRPMVIMGPLQNYCCKRLDFYGLIEKKNYETYIEQTLSVCSWSWYVMLWCCRFIHNFHDYYTAWWRHQMKTFVWVSGEFPSQRPMTRSFDVFIDLYLNKRLSKKSWGCWL